MDRFESVQPQNQSTTSRGADNHSIGSENSLLMRIIFDLVILLMVGFSILAIWLWVEPYKRDFSCIDKIFSAYSIRDSTIKTWMLFLIGAIPVVMILVTELIRAKLHENLAKIELQLFCCELPSWIIEAYRQIGIFVFGMLVCELATTIAKYSIGRYRPDFFNVCQPTYPGGSDCEDRPVPHFKDFTCSTGIDHQTLKELRLSFPSSHASFSAYTMVYSVIYLQIRMNWAGSKLFKHFLQFVLLMLALFTSLTRISDNKHYESDVFAGLFVGVAVALLVAIFIARLGRPEPRKCPVEVGYQSQLAAVA